MDQLLKVFDDRSHRSRIPYQQAEFHVSVKSIVGEIGAADERHLIYDGTLRV